MDVKKVLGTVLATIIRIIIAVTVLFFLYNATIQTYNFGYDVFADIPYSLAPGTDIQVTITETMDNRAIAEYFENVGLVKDWKLFYTQMLFSEYKETIHPGIYDLNNSMTSSQMLEIIGAVDENGDAVHGKPETTSGEEIMDTSGDTSSDETTGEVEMMDNDDWYDDSLDGDTTGDTEE